MTTKPATGVVTRAPRQSLAPQQSARESRVVVVDRPVSSPEEVLIASMCQPSIGPKTQI